MADRVGTEIAGYRVEDLIGRGGMSVVYLAEHVRLGRKVALKLLSPELAENDKFRERFLRESQIAASIDHPNIVPIYDADEENGILFIAMRYVEGTDLKELIRANGPLDPSRTVSLVTQIASALDAAHAHGLVHRDVKPGNVLLTREDHVYVADFGLTKRALSVSGLTKTGQLVGTIDYVAPEQIKGDPVDGRADVYSLGCVAYECLTAEVPYERDLEVAVLWAHVQEPPPELLTARSDLPAGVNGVITKAMAKQADERYETAGQLAADMGRALGSASADHALVEPSAGHSHRRRRLLVGVAGLVALTTLVIGWVLATDDDSPPVTLATPIGVARIDASSDEITTTARDEVPGWFMVAAEGALWETGPSGLVKRDAETGRIEKDDFDLQGETWVVAAGFQSIWVTVEESSVDAALVQISPATDAVVRTVDVSPARPLGTGAVFVATSQQAVWVLNGEGTLWKIDPITGRILSADDIASYGRYLTTGGGYVWVSDSLSNQVVRVDPSSGGTDVIQMGSTPDRLAFVGGTLWVEDAERGTITPIHASNLQPGAVMATPKDPGILVGGLGYLWIAADGVVARVDPLTQESEEIPVGFTASTVAPDESTNGVWVLRRPDPPT